MDQEEIQFPPQLPKWDCSWYWVEVIWALRVSDKILWWAVMTGITGMEFLRIMLRAFDEEKVTEIGSLQSHLMTREGRSHLESMANLIDWRISSLNCPDPEDILAAGLGDSTGVWLRVHDHSKVCQGSCAGEVEHLGRYVRELRILKGMTPSE